MKLKDISHGPDWIIWIVFAIFVILTIILLSGKGANLIAGYNTSGREAKSKYDKKKLSRVTGMGMLFITIFILVLALGEDYLPATIAYVFGAAILVDVVIIMILGNTICRKR